MVDDSKEHGGRTDKELPLSDNLANSLARPLALIRFPSIDLPSIINSQEWLQRNLRDVAAVYYLPDWALTVTDNFRHVRSQLLLV